MVDFVEDDTMGTINVISERYRTIGSALYGLEDSDLKDNATMALGLLVAEIRRWRHKVGMAEKENCCDGMCMATDLLEDCCATYEMEKAAAIRMRDHYKDALKEISSCGCQVSTPPCGKCVVCVAQKHLDTRPAAEECV